MRSASMIVMGTAFRHSLTRRLGSLGALRAGRVIFRRAPRCEVHGDRIAPKRVGMHQCPRSGEAV